MTNPEPLEPELDQLLRAARPLEAAPASARDRLARRLALSAAVPIVAAVAASMLGKDAAAGKDAASGASVGPAVPSGGLRALSPLAQKIAIGVMSFALGGGVGAAMHAAIERRGPREAPGVSATNRPASAVATAEAQVGAQRGVAAPPPGAAQTPQIPTLAATDLPLVPSAPSLGAGAAHVPAASASTSTSSGALAEERRLLDRARAALSRGEPASAMAPLEEHERRFPHGVLSEEREALAIQALARSDHAREAQDRATRFKKTFPGSMMTPAVDDALGAARDSR